ncbi:MAG: proline dehydrogenase family protein [Thermoleophilaceae bacterium]|nr:proline dehydrogenase family protein [Thermoleophilaceae bacterium]
MTARRIRVALATSGKWERAVRALPGGEHVAYRLARRYVAGARPADALTCAHRLAAEGLASSIDFFGESVSDPIEADRVADQYVALAQMLDEAPENTWLAIDLSHIGLDQPGEVVRQRLERIAAALPDGRRLQVGAEDERRADRILATVLAVAHVGGAVFGTIQANLKRSRADAQALADAEVPIRLVKGAYAEDPRVSRPWGEPTDLAFLELAHDLHANGADLALATHDPVLREALLRALPGVGVEMLLGVRGGDATALAARGVPVRIYVPYGDGWFRYAMRRWAESARV